MDVVVTAILTTVVAVVLYGLHSRLLFVSVDPLGTKVAGLSATRLDYLFSDIAGRGYGHGSVGRGHHSGHLVADYPCCSCTAGGPYV